MQKCKVQRCSSGAVVQNCRTTELQVQMSRGGADAAELNVQRCRSAKGSGQVLVLRAADKLLRYRVHRGAEF